jgi:hypothetical protein
MGIGGLLALAATLFFWLRPEGAAQGVGLTVANAIGLATVRADLAGFFGASGLFALLAAIRARPEYALPPIVLMSFAIVGRLLNIALGSFDPAFLNPIAIEAFVIAIFVGGYRVLQTST